MNNKLKLVDNIIYNEYLKICNNINNLSTFEEKNSYIFIFFIQLLDNLKKNKKIGNSSFNNEELYNIAKEGLEAKIHEVLSRYTFINSFSEM